LTHALPADEKPVLLSWIVDCASVARIGRGDDTTVAMLTSAGRRVRQGLLLCALAFAVLGIHHVAFGQHGAAHEPHSGGAHAAVMATSTGPTQPSDDSVPDTGHELMHLCLAVLSAAGGLLFTWLLVMLGTRTCSPGRVRPPLWHTWRSPTPAGRSLLASVCVLRI